jgi:hypothetical protein
MSLLAAGPASAAIATIPNDAITAAGSDTTENLMDGYFTCANGLTPTAPASCTSGYNIHAQPPADVQIPGDSFCSTQTYNDVAHTGVFDAPQGSSAGRRALRDSVSGSGNYPVLAGGNGGKGCVDVARSSAQRGVPDATVDFNNGALTEYYAYALDGITWGTTSLNAPASMTLAQLRQIYNCEITNWAELPGGSNGPIQRAMAQDNSGTQATFLSKLMGPVDPKNPTGVDSSPLALPCAAVKQVEENHGKYLLDPSKGGDPVKYQQYIYPYSAGKWVVQANNSVNPTLDIRGGLRVGALVTTPGDVTTATYAVRWTNSVFALNNTGLAKATLTTTDGVTNGTTTLTSATAAFKATDVGVNLEGTNIPAGAKIATFVSATQVTMTAAATGSSTVGTIKISAPPISEQNPGINDPSESRIFPGARYLYNVLEPSSPSYGKARCLVGFDTLDNNNVTIPDAVSTASSNVVTSAGATFTAADLCRTISDPSGNNIDGKAIITEVTDAHTIVISKVAIGSGTFSMTKTGAKSQLCNGDPDTGTIILSEGFLPLTPVTTGGNVAATCRIQ